MPADGGFLDEENMCGKQLLKIVARGVAIAVELLEISQHIPEVFQSQRRGEYSDLLFDFEYLKKQDELEQVIQRSPQLIEKDEEFRETHIDLLHRFYLLFESIWKYANDLLRFWEDIRDGFFIQQTFESILVDTEGKQLMAESVYYYGVMLLLLDMKIEGKVRERMLVSYLRYKGSSGEVVNIDDVCRLVRSTRECGPPGSERQPGKARQGYPEDYFARIKLPTDILDMIIGRIRSDDIYLMARQFPAPEHRSASLANQAAMLYVLLYFRPHILHESKPVMREIADKHFPDNWIITFYLGYHIDLTVAWSGYKAASQAIANTMSVDSVTYYQKENCQRLHKLTRNLEEILQEGVLTEAYVLDHIHSTLLPILRDCNSTLRWLLLHLTSTNKEVKKLVSQNFEELQVLMLLLNTSQLEYQLSQMFRGLIKVKADKWDESKEIAVKKMTKLSQYFGQEGVLAAEVKEEGLAEWFEDIADKIDDLDYGNAVQAGRKIQGLMTALTEVEEYHQVDENLQVKQFLIDTRALLRQMVRFVNIESEVEQTLSTIGDFTYGYELINRYVPMMQARIKSDPTLVMKLRSTFLKLSSMLEFPYLRMVMADSDDKDLVLMHFSTKLDKFVRQVLDIIPKSMFLELEEIVGVLTSQLQECETRMPKDMLRERAQPKPRYKLAKHTFQISKFTNGILAMETALMGVIPVEPQVVLTDGIRACLLRKLSNLLHENLQFQVDKKDKRPRTFEDRIDNLKRALTGLKRSFEYIQDYANVYGLRIWQEEYARLIGFNVEMECNRFLTKQILPFQSRYYDEAIPIPYGYPRPEGYTGDWKNFMGRLVEQLLDQTDPRRTIYVDQLSAWYDEKGGAVVGTHTFTALHQTMDTLGLAGADKLLSFMIVKDLQHHLINKLIRGLPIRFFQEMEKRLSPSSSLPVKVAREQYQMSDVPELRSTWVPMLHIILRVGRCQLLRKHIGKELRFACKIHSPALHASLMELNKALVNDVQAHYKSPMEKLYPNGNKPILPEFSTYLNQCGMNDPFTNIYCATDPVPHISTVLLTFVIAHLHRFQYDIQTDSLVKTAIKTKQKEPDMIDGVPFAIGVLTVLKQFHSEQKDSFVAYLCQYVRVTLSEFSQMPPKGKEKEREVVPGEVCNALHFLELFCRYGSVDRKQVENLLPPLLFAKYKEYSPRAPVAKK